MNKRVSLLVCVLLALSLIANGIMSVYITNHQPDNATSKTTFDEQKAQIAALVSKFDSIRDMENAKDIRAEMFTCHDALDNLLIQFTKEETVLSASYPSLSTYLPFDRFLLVHKTRDFLINSSDEALLGNLQVLHGLWAALLEVYQEVDGNDWTPENFYTAMQKYKGHLDDLYSGLR